MSIKKPDLVQHNSNRKLFLDQMKQGNNDNNMLHGTRKLTLADIHHQILHQHSPSLNKAVRRNFLLLLSGPLYRRDEIQLIMPPGSVCNIYNPADSVNTQSLRQLWQGHLLWLSGGSGARGESWSQGNPWKSRELWQLWRAALGDGSCAGSTSDQECCGQGWRGHFAEQGTAHRAPAQGLLWVSHSDWHSPHS